MLQLNEAMLSVQAWNQIHNSVVEWTCFAIPKRVDVSSTGYTCQEARSRDVSIGMTIHNKSIMLTMMGCILLGEAADDRIHATAERVPVQQISLLRRVAFLPLSVSSVGGWITH